MDTDVTLTRRRLIGTAAAGAAAAALPVTPALARSRRKADVVVIGGGLAGLTAARALAKHHHSVIVLEARDRVGGRTLNHPLGDGQVIEAGGEFVGPTQDRVLALAKAVGIGTYKAYNTGDDVFIGRGVRSTYASVPGLPNPPEDSDFFKDTFKLLNLFDATSAQVGVKAPWDSKKAAMLDRITDEQFKKPQLKSPNMPAILDSVNEALFGRDSADLSALFTNFYSAAAGDAKTKGSFARLIAVQGGAQESRLVGGSQEIALRVAAALGNRVVLSSPVRRVNQTRMGVTVVSDRVTVSAKRAIVAVPPVLAHAIRFSPSLSARHARLLARYKPGDMIKIQAIFDRPWWRDKGLTGQIVTDMSPAGITFDNTPQSGAPGVILGFVGGRKAAAFRPLSPDRRRQAFADELAAALGEEAHGMRDYFEMDWTAEPWTRGCPTGTLAPGVLSRFGSSLRPPTGRIHWAGTETSDFWAGYMDGAVRSGERAAREVLRAL